ncbi:MAG TPA: glucoamylase family protein [Terracidiphilus sp.]
MTDTATIPETHQPHSSEMLEYIRAAASWDVVHRPVGEGTFPSRVHAARHALKQLQHDLDLLSRTPSTPAANNSALLELRTNLRMLRSSATGVADPNHQIALLPRVVLPAQRDEPRAAAVAALYLRAVNGDFSAASFQAFMEALQNQDPLALEELWKIAAMLKFVLLESLLDEAHVLLGSPDPVSVSPVSAGIKSLRSISHTDWSAIIEPLIVFESTLRADPARTYAAMEFDSRELYRKHIAAVARHSDCTELQVAQAALDLARESEHSPAEDPRVQLRRVHVGHYLIGKGFPMLAQRTGYHAPPLERTRAFIRFHADDFYISGIQVLTVLFIAGLILVPLANISLMDCLIAVLMLILPVMQCAVDLANNSVTALFDPDSMPKLDFTHGIPADCATLVAVPTLLLNEKQVRALFNDLEVRFLANRDPHLHFALLTDLPDAVSKPRANDSDPLADLAVRLVDDLNRKYGHQNKGGFILLHRHRVFNVREGVWMGWERKRGKLLDLNKLLVGDFDAFPIKAGRLDLLHEIRYVLTLDSDTQLPRGSAARLIGAISHPLHQAVIDPVLRIVVDGYAILQPRIGVSVRSASRSRMATIYSGQSGFDIYSRAISDAYQDLYGEGSFTGKGIYEVASFHSVLDRRFPRNSLLSHDLIEGAYARAGLATDVELIDDYPSHLSAYNRRKHRWVRGDWQIAQWMFSRVPNESGKWVKNPISDVSRWKIFDNLRRSLLEPFTFILFVAGWLGLPGGPIYWTIVPLLLMIFPAVVQLSFAAGRGLAGPGEGRVAEAFTGFWKSCFTVLLNLVYLPYQAMLSLDAIIRALVRKFVTGERLLEWETAAEAETRSKKTSPADRYLVLTPVVACCVSVLAYFENLHWHNHALFVAAPILILWGLAPLVTVWLNVRPREQSTRLSPADSTFLQAHALRIWRYFHQFGEQRHNYLIPDNVEENGLYEAARVSPTNIGLLLNARQAASELGLLTAPEFVALTTRTLDTIEKLEKHRGHLFNWYDTQTLKPLDASPFVSSVDSGNLVASLYTLHMGARTLRRQPLLHPQLFAGLRAHWNILRHHHGPKNLLSQLALPEASASPAAWTNWLFTVVASETTEALAADSGDAWWVAESQNRVRAVLALLRDYMPWLLPEYAPLRAVPELVIKDDIFSLNVDDAAAFAEQLEESLRRAWLKLIGNPQLLEMAEQLRASLPAAAVHLQSLKTAFQSVAQTAERLAEDTDFSFLADPGRQILSIGYDVRNQKLHDACYDMVASEARIATFLAIARDQLPQQSWFRLSREHAHAFGRFLLLSWTGTMFEYLMPSLWMRSYPHTLISRTLGACVWVQRTFARRYGMAWGISESGAAKTDDAGHYHYHAFGVPQIALSAEAGPGPVVSPYSSFLALGVDSLASIRNLRQMDASGWVGDFGFYEAADYMDNPNEPSLVREWMAHHQGMSLLAIVNLLRDNAVQRWFHDNPLVQANELLLHEMPVSNAVLRARMRE